MIIPRTPFSAQLTAALARSSATVLLGPRQVGKTTLAKQLAADLPGSVYLDLEKSADLRKLDDLGGYLRQQSGHLTVLDEVHRLPELFTELRSVIDEARAQGERTAQFLLLGSASLDLVQQSSESLAGRVTYLEMPPISVEEALCAGIDINYLWLVGGFPESVSAGSAAASAQWRTDFIRSYLERDVPMFAPRMPATLIGRLWTMLANLQGTPLNAARLAQSLGVSAPAVARYLDLLADLLLVRKLSPWSSNSGKRLVRSPKVYVRDCGLVHCLLEIATYDQLLGHPVAGASWEGFVIENLIQIAGAGRTPYYYRTHDGAEIDLIFERAGTPHVAIEIKRSTAPKIESGFYIACADLDIKHRLVVYPGEQAYTARDNVEVVPLSLAGEKIRALFK